MSSLWQRAFRKCVFDADLIASHLVMRLLDLLGPGSVMGRVRAMVLALMGRAIGFGAIVDHGQTVRALFGDRLRIGAFTYVNHHCVFDTASPITIGRHCDIGFHVTFVTARHRLASDLRSRRPLQTEPNPIVVEDCVWIGCHSIILGGVTLGRGAVVAAGSVVTKDVAPNTLVGGNPARVIRSLEPTIAPLAASSALSGDSPVVASPPAVAAASGADAGTATGAVGSRFYTPRVYIERIAVDAFATLDHFLDRVVEDIRRPQQTYIGNLNVHAANIAQRDDAFRDTLLRADTVFCDGAGIVWASRLLGGLPLPQRFTSADFMPRLLQRLAAEGLRAYFLGSAPGVAQEAMDTLSRQVPNHTMCGWHHGYLSDPAINARVIAEINRLKPDILFVGMGMPRQEQWVQAHRRQLAVRCVMPLGATLDYFSGRAPRCPAWMADIGLEWLFRLCLEPRRMAGRYVLGNPVFMARILSQVVCQRLPMAPALSALTGRSALTQRS